MFRNELSHMVPKQRQLTETETPTSFESWKESLCFILSLDRKFARFLDDLKTWSNSNVVNRGFINDTGEVDENIRMSAVQKALSLEHVLGIVAGYAPVISHSYVKNSALSLEDIFNRLRSHYGFRRTGSRITELMDLRMGPSDSRECLWEKFYSFMEGNLLTANGISHEGVKLELPEIFTPTLLNTLVVLWLHAIHPTLPSLVRQRFSTTLRSQTIYSIRDEISESIPSLLQELEERESATNAIGMVSRSSNGFPQNRDSGRSNRYQNNRGQGRGNYRSSTAGGQQGRSRRCTLCYQAKRPDYHTHFLSQCPFLSTEDKAYFSKIREVGVEDDDYYGNEIPADDVDHYDPSVSACKAIDELDITRGSSTCRVEISSSPELEVEINNKSVAFSLDSGAESNLMKLSVCKALGLKIEPTTGRAVQGDGITKLDTVGEVHVFVNRTCAVTGRTHRLQFNGLVVKTLGSPVLAGMPFHRSNDVYSRPGQDTIYIGDCCGIRYDGSTRKGLRESKICRAVLLRVPQKTCLLPGESISVKLPVPIESESVALEPRYDSPSQSTTWMTCSIKSTSSGSVDLQNTSNSPVLIRRNEQVCQVRPAVEVSEFVDTPTPDYLPQVKRIENSDYKYSSDINQHSSSISIDPSNMLNDSIKKDFEAINHKFDHVFSPDVGKYNGHSGRFKHIINMGPSLPPQQRGRVPQYDHGKKVLLQEKFDELQQQGVFAKPEDLGIVAEYVSPSFLVSKSSGGHRLVTAFSQLGDFIKPQPSIMPNTDDVIRQIGQWKFIIKTDLCSAYYQIELDKASLKYTGVVTPFRGVLVYTRSVMGLAGSEAALEELLSKILGDLMMNGQVVKLADDLYCGADSPEELVKIWESVVSLLSLNGLKLKPSKTVICPKSTEILGWVWENGTLRASPHRINALSACSPPDTVKGLRSFIGAYKFCCRVLPAYSSKLSPLDQACAGAKSADKITWTDELLDSFNSAKAHLKDAKVISLPRREDRLQIICDASKTGLGSALYIIRDKPLLAGIFNVQLKGSQKTWLPCEVEALSVGCGVNHFGPYIVQSKHVTEVLTDSKPCIQAYGKLQRGSFSASARVTTFLSTISRYGVKLSHIAGHKNVLSDYFSRNPLACDGGCQICTFVEKAETSAVREIQVSDILDGRCAVPFTTRSTWHQCQQDDPVLKAVSRYLTEGRSPPKKKKGMKEVKRYLNVVKLSTQPNDGLLVVPQEIPLMRTRHKIVVPRDIVDGLLTALHLQLNHPSKYQLKQVFIRGFFALDADKAVERTVDGCHTCAALKKVPTRFKTQTTTVPVDEGIGKRYSADVIRRERQFILLVREYVSSYVDACFVHGETADNLTDGIIRLLSKFRAPTGPPVTLRVDPAPGFDSSAARKALSQQHINIEVGEPKNVNHNPVAEKAISEFHGEIARLVPTGGPLDEVTLALAVSNLNSRIRHGGLSASEVWYQRDMFTGAQLPIKDIDIVRSKATNREKGHLPSAKYHARGSVIESSTRTLPGDIVYLFQDRDKTRSRDKYLVVRTDGRKSEVQKFVGTQIRSKVYTVDNSDIIKVKPHLFTTVPSTDNTEASDDDVRFVLGNRKNEDPVIQNQPPHEEPMISGEESDDNDQEPHFFDRENMHLSAEEVSTDGSESTDESEPTDEEVRAQDVESDRELVNDDADSVESDVDMPESPPQAQPRRSGRTRKEPDKFKSYLTGKRLSEVVPLPHEN